MVKGQRMAGGYKILLALYVGDKAYLTVSAQELRTIRDCLLRWRNKLISEGRIADPIDEMLERLVA